MNRLLALLFMIFASFQSHAGENNVQPKATFEINNSEILTLESRVLGRSYDIYIKLPAGYADKANENKSFPVLYLNDGPHTFKVAAGVTHFRSMDSAIIVGISFAQGEDGQFSRVRDLTPETDTRWTRYKTGGASQYLQFIERELIPWVETNYRADPGRRILAGHSLGGSFGAWVLITRPELFSGYILTSPSLWYKNELIFDLEEEYAARHKSLNARVFFATGALETPANGMEHDMVAGHRKFVQRLRSRQYQDLHIQDEIVSGTDHFSTFPVGLTKGLRWLYQLN